MSHSTSIIIAPSSATNTSISYKVDGTSYDTGLDYPFAVDNGSAISIIFADGQTPVAKFSNGTETVLIDYSAALSPGINDFGNPQISTTGVVGGGTFSLTTYNYSIAETPSYNAPFTAVFPTFQTIDTTFQINAPCLHHDTIVDTLDGPIKISDLRSPNKLFDHNNQPVDLLFNIKFSPKNEFISIQKNTFGVNIPYKDLLICKNHPVLIDGKEIQPINLINDDSIKIVNIKDSTNVYSLCTQERIFVMMQGIPVCTWSKNDFEKEIVGKFYFEKL